MKLYYPVCIDNNKKIPMELCSTGGIDNNRKMKLYSPGCMDNNRKMKLHYPVCMDNNRQMKLYYPVCIDNNRKMNCITLGIWNIANKWIHLFVWT
jgi:hypothetical protein